MTPVRFLSAVNSAVPHEASWQCKSFATKSTFKRFLCRMTSPVSLQLTARWTASATFAALVFTRMNIHMPGESIQTRKTFLTLSTWINRVSSATVPLNSPTRCLHKLFSCTQIWCWLVIMQMLSCMLRISFSLYLGFTGAISARLKVPRTPWTSTTQLLLLLLDPFDGLFSRTAWISQ